MPTAVDLKFLKVKLSGFASFMQKTQTKKKRRDTMINIYCHNSWRELWKIFMEIRNI